MRAGFWIVESGHHLQPKIFGKQTLFLGCKPFSRKTEAAVQKAYLEKKYGCDFDIVELKADLSNQGMIFGHKIRGK